MPALIDTHCHLTSRRFGDELEAVIQRSREAGLVGAITIGTGLDDAREALEIARRFHGFIACAAGLDPFSCHEAGDDFETQFAGLERLLAAGGFCALGEIGLEYHHPVAPKPAQKVHCERQLDLAARLDLPVVLHVREAHADMLDLLGRHPRNHGVVHSFSGGAEEARAYLALGWHLAFNGMITFPGNDALRVAAAAVPNDRLLVETDSPYLAPVPHRGRRCEPALVVHTLATLAELRAQRPEDLAAWTTRNAVGLFRLPPVSD
jgi:TatD DNase family protein